MSGELFLLKSVPVNSFLSIPFDLFNIILSLCTSSLPTEETMKANHTDLQPALPPWPTELHGWVFRASGSRWGSSATPVSCEELGKRQHCGLKVLAPVQPRKGAVRETELLQMPLSFSRAAGRSGRGNDSASHNLPPRLFPWALD